MLVDVLILEVIILHHILALVLCHFLKHLQGQSCGIPIISFCINNVLESIFLFIQVIYEMIPYVRVFVTLSRRVTILFATHTLNLSIPLVADVIIVLVLFGRVFL